MICLLSTSVDHENEENVEKVLEKKLIPYINMIFQNSHGEHARYIPCLNLISRLANAKTEAANEFMEAAIHINLIQSISNSIQRYMDIVKINNQDIEKKFRGKLKTKDKKEIQRIQERLLAVDEDKMQEYETLAAQIKTLGGLLLSDPEKRKEILEHEVVKSLINIMKHPAADPILLTAVCTFALDLFECDELKESEEQLR